MFYLKPARNYLASGGLVLRRYFSKIAGWLDLQPLDCRRYLGFFGDGCFMLDLVGRAARKIRKTVWGGPAPGAVDFGSLRRLSPISVKWGHDRGQPIGRYYVGGFLEKRAADVRGRVLEFGDATYTKKLGGAQVTQSDVMNYDPNFPGSTFVGDLAEADNILPSDAFDCIIFTQCLQSIYDPHKALRQINRVLKPGGVLLFTVSAIDKPYTGNAAYPYYYCFSPAVMEKMFADCLPGSSVEMETHGNVFAVMCSLYGIAAGEVESREIDFVDPVYPLIIAARVTKG